MVQKELIPGSRVSSSDFPTDLLLAAAAIDFAGMDEIAEHACRIDINPFTRSMSLPPGPNLVIRYDETGETPLTLEAGFNRYQMHTDLLTAQLKVQFEI